MHCFRVQILAAVLCLLSGIPGGVRAQTVKDVDRGELLYSTYCSACHRTEIHWRDRRLATDWDSLMVQVRRWQANTGRSWDEGDTFALAHYLNTRFYQFAPNRGL